MKHPCSGCKQKSNNGRVYCPEIDKDIALEGCNRIHNNTPTNALVSINTILKNEVKGYHTWAESVNQALNSGDGSYRP